MITKRKQNLLVSLAIGLIMGAFTGWEFTMGYGWKYGLTMGMAIGLVGMLFTLCQFDTRKTQNEAVFTITDRKKAALTAGGIIGIIFGAFLGVVIGIPLGAAVGTTVAIIGGLVFGSIFGLAVLVLPGQEY